MRERRRCCDSTTWLLEVYNSICNDCLSDLCTERTIQILSEGQRRERAKEKAESKAEEVEDNMFDGEGLELVLILEQLYFH